jgi:hypothetical protein
MLCGQGNLLQQNQNLKLEGRVTSRFNNRRP